MQDASTEFDRRRLLTLVGTGVTMGLAGCNGGDGDGGTATPEPTDTATPTTVADVPAAYETATALDGTERDPSAVSTKEAVQYQTESNDGAQCSGCRFYIPDKNGDGVGACAVVEGTIDPSGWCASYVAYEGDGGETETAASAAEAVTVPSDANCPVCNMVPAEYPDWNAQVVHEDGERAFFDTAGCMVTYYALPDEFAATDAPITGVWVTDFETRERVDGTTAHYALETDSERVNDPMRRNPAPFADRADAVAYVDAVDYLTTDDIVGLDAFDRDLAVQYRRRFVEDA
ncbi:nitrous oxide reductase accessory protein NosL [Halorientalis litorea]|jgi:copper chaperone NosL|uniref:nitrous oxide reductase accessory protein NosL n=1 Tax=Halorientalis litorea TaxID=2931977 RepID=UPI001FF37728|nr:nitrous oxide reductase accessory protein NosL [Halorientalis litorea]